MPGYVDETRNRQPDNEVEGVFQRYAAETKPNIRGRVARLTPNSGGEV